MPEVRIERAAKKDLKRIGPGPERHRILAGLRRLAEDAPTLDITAIAGAAPGWCRLRIGEYRICYYRAPRGAGRRFSSPPSTPSGPPSYRLWALRLGAWWAGGARSSAWA